MGTIASKPRVSPSISKAPSEARSFDIASLGVGHAAPGQIKLDHIALPEVRTEGGILVLHNTVATGKAEDGSYDNARYGVVIACGEYLVHRSMTHIKSDDFPLPPGTLVEFKPMQNPYRDIHKRMIIKTEDLLWWWLPGEWKYQA